MAYGAPVGGTRALRGSAVPLARDIGVVDWSSAVDRNEAGGALVDSPEGAGAAEVSAHLHSAVLLRPNANDARVRRVGGEPVSQGPRLTVTSARGARGPLTVLVPVGRRAAGVGRREDG